MAWPWNLGYRSLKLIENGKLTIRKLGYGFLFAFHSKYGHIVYHLRDVGRKSWFFIIHPHSTSPLWGRSPSQYCHKGFYGKLQYRMVCWLPDGKQSLRIAYVYSFRHNTRTWQTDRRTRLCKHRAAKIDDVTWRIAELTEYLCCLTWRIKLRNSRCETWSLTTLTYWCHYTARRRRLDNGRRRHCRRCRIPLVYERRARRSLLGDRSRCSDNRHPSSPRRHRLSGWQLWWFLGGRRRSEVKRDVRSRVASRS